MSSFSTENDGNSGFINIEWTSAEKQQITNIISKKLSTISHYNDDVLPEYVVVMIQNKKSKNHVSKDLDAFLGNKSKEFTNWLWDMLLNYEREGKFPLDISTPSFSSNSNSVNYDPSDVFEADNPSPIQEQNESNIDEDETTNNSNIKSSLNSVVVTKQRNDRKNSFRSPSDVRRYRPPPPKTRESRGKDKVLDIRTSNSRLIMSAMKEAAESTSKFPKKDFQDMQVENSTSSDNYRKSKINENSFNSKEINKQQKRKLFENKFHDFQDEIPEENPEFKKNKIRCSFWPNCTKAENCPYHHPTEPCKNFPKCSFGEKCLYVHPNILCKFGENCTRVNCAYNHPSTKLLQLSTPLIPVTVPVPCKNGFACSRDGCRFSHPSEICRYGKHCTKGKSCPFSHSIPCKFGSLCTTPGCVFAHTTNSTIPCKFGEICTNKATCKFYHAEIEAEQMKKLHNSLPKTPPREQNTQTEFSGTELQINLTEDMKED